MNVVVGIEASRNRSGGAKAHLLGLLGAINPVECGVSKVHLWSYQALLDEIPNYPWLIKHQPAVLKKSIVRQLCWQYQTLPKEARLHQCHVMLYTDAGAMVNFSPSVVMSRDMLSYEKGEMKRFGLSKAFLRLLLLKYIQAKSMQRADGVIFLTRYAAKVIQNYTGKLLRVAIIPHGIGSIFKQTQTTMGHWIIPKNKQINCIYVSNAAMYKHQWHVVRAIAQLRGKGYNFSLVLAGGGAGKAQQKLDQELAISDPMHQFVTQLAYTNHDNIAELYTKSDLFIFASSCENMPNTLLEAMATGLPIACSDRGPMPEVLKDAGVYFDPENADSIANAVEKIITTEDLRVSIASRAKLISQQYSWERCARETWDYLRVIAHTGNDVAMDGEIHES